MDPKRAGNSVRKVLRNTWFSKIAVIGSMIDLLIPDCRNIARILAWISVMPCWSISLSEKKNLLILLAAISSSSRSGSRNSRWGRIKHDFRQFWPILTKHGWIWAFLFIILSPVEGDKEDKDQCRQDSSWSGEGREVTKAKILLLHFSLNHGMLGRMALFLEKLEFFFYFRTPSPPYWKIPTFF